jgi:hypothetical protein
MKQHENPSDGSRAVADRQTDGHGEVISRYSRCDVA